MSERAITHSDPDRPPMPRISTILGTIALAVTLGTLIWGMSAIVGSKADKETVHKIQTTVEVIRNRQEWFIDELRPGLLKGKE